MANIGDRLKSLKKTPFSFMCQLGGLPLQLLSSENPDNTYILNDSG